MKVNPPQSARNAANAELRAKIAAAKAINNASIPASRAASYAEGFISEAVALDEAEKRLWFKLLTYREVQDYLLTLAPNESGHLDYRLAVIMRWLTNSSPQDFIYALQIQEATNRKYGDLYHEQYPVICLSCEQFHGHTLGGRLVSSCPKCAKPYIRKHAMLLFRTVISHRMFISHQEFTARLATELLRKVEINEQR